MSLDSIFRNCRDGSLFLVRDESLDSISKYLIRVVDICILVLEGAKYTTLGQCACGIGMSAAIIAPISLQYASAGAGVWKYNTSIFGLYRLLYARILVVLLPTPLLFIQYKPISLRQQYDNFHPAVFLIHFHSYLTLRTLPSPQHYSHHPSSSPQPINSKATEP